MSDFKRGTGLLVIEVVDSNPNGDPDREGEPRQRPNRLGEISPVSFKRKLRDLLEDPESDFFKSLPPAYSEHPERYCILESRGRIRRNITEEMVGEGKGKGKLSFSQHDFLQSAFVGKYWDARLFGNTFLEKEANKGFIKSGVVQFGVGISISPISIVQHTLTNKAGVQGEKSAGMAPLAFRIVEHGVYCMPFFVNPHYASKTGCTAEDIALLKLLIPYAYDLNRSAIRPDVRIRHAWYIEHANPLGSCPDYLLTEALTPTRKDDPQIPSQSWADYEDKTALPEGLRAKVASVVDLMA